MSRARFQNVIVRVEDDSVRLWPAESLHGESGFFPGDVDLLEFGVSLGLDFNFHFHVEDIQVLLCLANDPESFFGAVDHVLQIEFRDSRRMKPLREEWAQAGWPGGSR